MGRFSSGGRAFGAGRIFALLSAFLPLAAMGKKLERAAGPVRPRALQSQSFPGITGGGDVAEWSKALPC
ncbi:hypothetical protein CW354_19205 [Marinicaulis flavus]|uniref:Uncharacterized protein n=1 Tax=Hyphococcus luteus TaxID=2058213 RepID=A0A2S7K1Z7_9PROT|nr:hypothetical protein CW354_19205 [Marinicaulis flavus]